MLHRVLSGLSEWMIGWLSNDSEWFGKKTGNGSRSVTRLAIGTVSTSISLPPGVEPFFPIPSHPSSHLILRSLTHLHTKALRETLKHLHNIPSLLNYPSILIIMKCYGTLIALAAVAVAGMPSAPGMYFRELQYSDSQEFTESQCSTAFEYDLPVASLAKQGGADQWCCDVRIPSPYDQDL